MAAAARVRFVTTVRMAALVLCWSISAPGSAWGQEVRYLYTPLAAGQLLDWHSTRTALARPGTREANALLRTCVQSDPCLLGLKSALTAGVVASMEFARKKHPKAGFWTTLGITVATSAVAVHNYRQGR